MNIFTIFMLSYLTILIPSNLIVPDVKNRRCTAQKVKFSIKYFFSKFNQIRRKLRIWSQLQKKSLMENFIFCIGCPAAYSYLNSNLLAIFQQFYTSHHTAFTSIHLIKPYFSWNSLLSSEIYSMCKSQIFISRLVKVKFSVRITEKHCGLIFATYAEQSFQHAFITFAWKEKLSAIFFLF